jgi:hypothetical protein
MAIKPNAISIGSAFNIQSQGPIDSRMVVNSVEDLITVWNTDAPPYIGMVVSVIGSDSDSDSDENGEGLYVLMDEYSDKDPFVAAKKIDNWKKTGSDSKLSAPITVAGLGQLGNVKDGDEYKIGHSIEDILRDILCTELYSKEIKLETIHSKIEFGDEYIIGATAKNYSKLMKVGSVLELNEVTLNAATISTCSRQGIGFEYGYSADNDNSKDGDGYPEIEEGTIYNLTGNYTLEEKYEGLKEGEAREKVSSETLADVKFPEVSVKIGLGPNTITFIAHSPGGNYTLPQYPDYYDVSNLGKTSNEHKLVGASAESKTLDSVKGEASISVTGVYPVYVNIDSGKLISNTKEMPLISGKSIEIDVPSEVVSGINFKFDYPKSYDVVSFKIWSPTENEFVDFAASYNKKSEIVEKDINGVKYDYNRLVTTGDPDKGPGIYKITLSKGLGEK